MSDQTHERIFLSPPCCSEEETYWCQDRIDECNCDEPCGDIEYVRADLYEALQARIDELEGDIKDAMGWNWLDDDALNPELENMHSLIKKYLPEWLMEVSDD